jgi:hypothetical protein
MIFPSSDQVMVRPLLLVALTATLAIAESHPNWLAYASPEATAVVGIQWSNLRQTPLAAAIEAEISASGALGFPDLDCLKQAREIVVTSPPLLAEESGNFPPTTVQDQAERQGLRGLVYRGVQLWLPRQADKLGVAQISDQLILVGAEKTLETAVDGGLSEGGRQSSALLTRAARSAQTGDLWVLAMKLPDPLAGRFVPLEARAWEFQGQASVRDGLAVEASFDAGSEQAAAEVARGLREKASTFPTVARSLKAEADHADSRRVTIALHMNSEDLVAVLQAAPALELLRSPRPPAFAIAGVLEGPAGPQPPEGLQSAVEPEQLATPVRFEITHVESTQPRIIRIFNLEEGTREITLPFGH